MAAVIFFLLATLPPASEHLTTDADSDLHRRTVAGAYHIHTTRSDGIADKGTVAAAAARVGLKFAIFTDHGDGTRPPDPPAYVDGVLCIDGVEISTDDGHYVALGIPAAPYPLGGAGAAVAEDVARLGGFGVIAHPDSAKASLRWRGSGVPADAVEWLNADSEWRDERRAALVRALMAYVVRPAAALASLLDRPEGSLARWDAMTRQRPVVALAAHDAHGGVGGAVEDGDRSWVARVPSYDAAFATMATRVIVDRPLGGEAAQDAQLILDALRRGHAFTSIDAVATPASLDFRVQSGGRELAMGESGVFSGAASLVARAGAPDGSRTVLFRDGQEVAAADGSTLEHRLETAGVYRVEVHAPKAPGTPPVPWLLSNPIYLRTEEARDAAPRAPAAVVRDLGALSWRVEHDPASRAALTTRDGILRVDYELRNGDRGSQFAAAAADLPPDTPPFDVVRFTATASAPMRLSVQLRFGTEDARWGTSVYIGTASTTVEVSSADMRRAGAGERSEPPASNKATALLLVVDLTNAAPGAVGWFSVERPALTVGAR